MLKLDDEPLLDINGVPFIQRSVFDCRKNVGLYLKISQQTKADIEHLCRVYNVSQSGLVSALVEAALQESRKAEN